MESEILPFSQYSQLEAGKGYVFNMQTDLFSLTRGKYYGTLTSVDNNGRVEKSCVIDTTYYRLQFDNVIHIPTSKTAHSLYITVCNYDPEYIQIYKEN